WDESPICIGSKSNGKPEPWGYMLQCMEHRMTNRPARAPPHETPTDVRSNDCACSYVLRCGDFSLVQCVRHMRVHAWYAHLAEGRRKDAIVHVNANPTLELCVECQCSTGGPRAGW